MMILHRILFFIDEWRYGRAVGLFGKAEKRLAGAARRVDDRIQRAKSALAALTVHHQALTDRSETVDVLRGNLKKITTERL